MQNKEYYKKYYESHKENKKLYKKEYYKKNLDYIKKRNKDYYEKNKKKMKEIIKIYSKVYEIKNREKRKCQKKIYYKNNKVEINNKSKEYRSLHIEEKRKYDRKYYNNKRLIDINYKIKQNLRGRIRQAIKNGTRPGKSIEMMGCTIEQLKIYLSNKFTSGMNWQNYGEWHIDHILPCAMFDLNDPKQQKICFNYKNLQPLWARDNIIKRDKIIKKIGA